MNDLCQIIIDHSSFLNMSGLAWAVILIMPWAIWYSLIVLSGSLIADIPAIDPTSALYRKLFSSADKIPRLH